MKDIDTGYGFNLGILLESLEGTRIGVTYRSAVDFEFNDSGVLSGVKPPLSNVLSRTGIAGSDVRMNMKIHQDVMFSIAQRINDQLTLLGNLGWQDFSEFGHVGVSLYNTSDRALSMDANMGDVWHEAFGIQYRIALAWLLSTGVAYDTSPVSEENRSAAMPLDRQIRLGAGVQYDINEDVTVGVAYTCMDAGEAKLDQTSEYTGSLRGDYPTNNVYIVNANLIWRF